MFRKAVVAGAVALASLAATGVDAAEDAPFYKGKQLTILVNFAPGGPTDVEARLFTRHLTGHVAGAPQIIIRNMDGAGGMSGANYLGAVAPQDGTYVGYFSSVPWIYAVQPTQSRVPLENFQFVAYQPGTAIQYMRTDVKPGIKNVDEIGKAEDVVVGGLSRDNAKDIMMRLALDLLGVKYKYATGYPGSQGARLALQRGEINYYAESPPVYRTTVIELVRSGEVIPLYFDPSFNGTSYSVPTSVQGLGIPSFRDVYQKMKGKDPEGLQWDAYLAATTVNNGTQRLVLLPPHTPPEAMVALQASIHEMEADPDYIKDATAFFGYVPKYVADAATDDTVRNMLNVKPEVRTFIQEYMKAN